jgi:hypothetical protein
VTTASTSVTFNTLDDGKHYNIEVQAHCYNAAGGDSGWTASATASVYTATPYCTLTVNSAGNGTASGGGSYDCGYTPAAPVITASASSYYQFSSWSGSGCLGGVVNPVAISMTGTITCTANFVVIPISPNVPSVWNNGVWGTQTGFSWTATCNGPVTAVDIAPSTWNGGTLLEGWYSYGYGQGTNNINSVTMLTPSITYTEQVRIACYNPYAGWTGYAIGSVNYYRDYWYPGVYSGAPAWVYYSDDGTQRRYKTTDTANASPQSSGGSLVSPQAYPAVDFSLYPAQNNCKAIGGRTPTQNELIGMYNATTSYGAGFYHDAFGAFGIVGGYRTNEQNSNDTTQAVNRNMDINSRAVSAKTNSNPIRCVKD